MREIKFRANHTDPLTGEPNTISEVATIHFDSQEIILRNKQGSYTLVEKLENVELMQYTGLKDKNGMEIYEGDIVETPSSKAKYLVDYVDGCFVGRIKYREYVTLYKGLKVIGNIHEDPEMIK